MKAEKIAARRTLATQLPAYGIAAGAALTGTSAFADIVTNDTSFTMFFNPANIHANDFITQFAWDIDGDATTDFNLTTFQNATSGGGAFYNCLMAINQVDNSNLWLTSSPELPSNIAKLAPLPDGTVVGPTPGAGFAFGSNFAVYPLGILNGIYSPLSSGSQKIGFQFMATDGLHYGWATLTLNIPGDFYDTASLTIDGWAYNDTPGEAIDVGAVPEPSAVSLGLLALGAAGVAAYKRSRRQRSQAE